MAKETNLVKLTASLINSTPIKDLVELEPVKRRWIATYMKTTGLPAEQADLIYEQEKNLFIKTVSTNDLLAQCEPFSGYDCWMTICNTRVSLREGMAYLVPFKKKMTLIIGWKGRLQQLFEMPDIRHIHEPQVVYDNDLFQMELGTNPRVIQHVPNGKGPRVTEGDKKSIITYVYLVIDYADGVGPKTVFMDRAKVLSIRDRYSAGWKKYLKDLPNITPDGKIEKTGRNGNYTADYDFPMWVTSEEEAFKKTIVRRTYNNAPNKLGRHKFLDQKMSTTAGDDLEALSDFADQRSSKPTKQNVKEPSYEDLQAEFEEMEPEKEDGVSNVSRGTLDQERVDACLAIGMSDNPEHNGYTWTNPKGGGCIIFYEQIEKMTPEEFKGIILSTRSDIMQQQAALGENTATGSTETQDGDKKESPGTDTPAVNPEEFKKEHDTPERVKELIGKADKGQLAQLYFFNSDMIDKSEDLTGQMRDKKKSFY